MTTGRFLIRKCAGALATMLAMSLLIFAALEVNVADVAVKVLGQYSTAEQRAAWLTQHGYDAPFALRYLRWLGAFATGDWGQSTHFRAPVTQILLPRLGASAVLAGPALLVIVGFGLVLGVLAGMRPGTMLDRVISVAAIITTSIPDFATAVFLSAIFVFGLGLLPGASTMISGFSIRELILPVAVLALYSTGYLARVTRASMLDVMAAPYIRTARLKGAGLFHIVWRHALRNALVTPITVILLQLPWLLSGVIVVEVFYAYKGFGSLLYEAALNQDIYLIEACAMISVLVVVVSQILSDAIHRRLNPRMDEGA